MPATVPAGLLWLAVAGTFPVAMVLGLLLGTSTYFHPVRHTHRATTSGRHRWKP